MTVIAAVVMKINDPVYTGVSTDHESPCEVSPLKNPFSTVFDREPAPVTVRVCPFFPKRPKRTCCNVPTGNCCPGGRMPPQRPGSGSRFHPYDRNQENEDPADADEADSETGRPAVDGNIRLHALPCAEVSQGFAEKAVQIIRGTLYRSKLTLLAGELLRNLHCTCAMHKRP